MNVDLRQTSRYVGEVLEELKSKLPVSLGQWCKQARPGKRCNKPANCPGHSKAVCHQRSYKIR